MTIEEKNLESANLQSKETENNKSTTDALQDTHLQESLLRVAPLKEGQLKNILEAAMLAVSRPMSIEQLAKLFVDEERPSVSAIKESVKLLQLECEGRGVELLEVASGYRYQSRQEYSLWLSRLWEERPAKYSRAALETLALIAYRQPVTRAEIEDVRGVGVSSSIVKTMIEREWIRVVGHRDVPGRPALYATTKEFLDYFNMQSLEELPSLAEIKDLEDINPELGLPNPDDEREKVVKTDVEGGNNESGNETKNEESLQTIKELSTDVDLQVEAELESKVELELKIEHESANNENDELTDVNTEASYDSFYEHEPKAE